MGNRTTGHKLEFLISALLWILLPDLVSGQDLVKFVQPLAGTASSTTAAALKHSEGGSEKNANTIPSVCLPFAMTQWTPQTRTSEKKCLPPYYYKDSLLNGFRGTHWLSGSCVQDYGSVTVMPVKGKLRTSAVEYALPLSHSSETTTPEYYKLIAGEIVSEMTATLRCGFLRFSVLDNDSLYILITPNSDEQQGFVKIDPEKGEIWGYNPVHRIYQGWGQPAGFSGWFYIRVNRSTSVSGSFSEGHIFLEDTISNQKDIGVFAGFSLRKGEQIELRVGTSFTSLEGAKKNLETEIGNRSFDQVRSSAQETWDRALSRVKVETVSDKDKRIFYTAMYHAIQHPRLFNDVDGLYPAFAGNKSLMKTEKGNYYDDFSMWDIYRAQLPLVQILDRGITNDFVRSMILKGQQGNWLPIFPCWNSYTSAMIGDHVTVFIASAYAKGIRDYDVSEAYRLMRKNAFEVAPEADYLNGMGRRALTSWLKYGFIPLEDSVPIAFHKKEQVSRTLEYAYDDHALSVVARGLGRKEDQAQLVKRALNYVNVFDSSVGMVRGRYADRSWYKPFFPDRREFYITEGTPRQYGFYVPHDIPGLAALMGGRNRLEQALDSLFIKGEYWHGNEPGHQIPFLYNYTAAPWKTQQAVYEILSGEYSDGPGGLSGNDDSGQMSAWYVFAAMGFYPVDPVSGNYMLTAPIFDQVRLQLPAGKQLTITCHRKNAGDKYISSVSWNGKKYAKNYLTHSGIMNGGIIEIWLDNKPTGWGSELDAQVHK
ncbi:MAG TPA: GH92 family glycosyl hydrolase [Chitinophagaceae bacterium]|nr:GH92 family glycosyl hydrolase [Chitinophagaceae bacterium]